ncbi:MAG TPA: response regulator [Pirellulales bacterium]
MMKPVYYVQECPTCGRSLQIRVAYLGRRMVCQHCLGEFEAIDPANKQNVAPEVCGDLLARADDLLATAGRQLEFLDD